MGAPVHHHTEIDAERRPTCLGRPPLPGPGGPHARRLRRAGCCPMRFRALETRPADRDLDCGPLISARSSTWVRGVPAARGRTDGSRTACGAGGWRPTRSPGGFYCRSSTWSRRPRRRRRSLRPPDRAGGRCSAPSSRCSRFTDVGGGVRLANATDFGLVRGIWTCDGGRQIAAWRGRSWAGAVLFRTTPTGAGGRAVETAFRRNEASRASGGRRAGRPLTHFTRAERQVAIHHG